MGVLHARDVYLTGRRSRTQLRPDHCVLGRMMVVQSLGHERDMSAQQCWNAGCHRPRRCESGWARWPIRGETPRAREPSRMRRQPSLHLPASDAETHVRTLTMPHYPAHASSTRLLDLVTADWLWRDSASREVACAAEVEHVVQHAGSGVERIVTDATGVPVVLDEPQNRGLTCLRVVDETTAPRATPDRTSC
jgi:hypothetical protein